MECEHCVRLCAAVVMFSDAESQVVVAVKNWDNTEQRQTLPHVGWNKKVFENNCNQQHEYKI